MLSMRSSGFWGNEGRGTGFAVADTMRFAFISTMHDSPWGGCEELWSQTAVRLHRAGHAVMASVGFRPEVPKPILSLRQQGIRMDTHVSRWASVPRRVWNRISSRDRRTHSALLRFRPDLVVISQGFNAGGFAWARTCRAAGVPYVIVVHCNSELWWFGDELEEALAAYRGARTVYCVSRQNLDLLTLQLGEPLPHAEIVRNPWNVPSGPPPPWPEDASTWRLACVARLDPAAKGQDILARILSSARWRERPVELNFYGRGPEESALRRMIAMLDLPSAHLRGHVPDVAGIWRDNHLLVLPSRYEGLPLALIEAMWCGRPSVVTDVGGNAELLADNRTGFIARAATVEAFDEALERAWQRREQWKEMGQAARREVEAQIPADPVGLFCEKLEAAVLAGRGGKQETPTIETNPKSRLAAQVPLREAAGAKQAVRSQ